ncbi:MAG: tyrosine-type recombinase/integrase [Paludibacteraceae bacterium]|nr:tyrosine-type recombinase/integrase [Paludibacteraceae bacterium]MBP6284078.1 tyrosine-type recombinase/integrase [Paludibacteraceae bacterium]
MMNSFITYLQYEKKFSSHTVLAYKEDLSQFQLFICSRINTCNFSTIDASLAREWVVSLKQAQYSISSINRKISTLKSFYTYCKKQSITTASPFSSIHALKNKKQLPVFLKDMEMEELLSSDDIFTKSPYENARDRIVIEIFYHTGIRRDELINLKDGDINLFSLTLQVTGKGNKQRLIPFSKTLQKSIGKYLAIKAETIKSTSDSFILSNKGKPAYPMLLYRIVQEYIGKVSSVTKKSPHVIRHTFASALLNNGAEINAVKELLGHANLAATQIYTHTTFEQLKKSYKQAHPRD